MSKQRYRGPAYITVENGKWFPVRKRDQLLACCDCGLVHSADFRVRKDGKIELRMYRLPGCTKVLRQRRRRHGNQSD